MRRGEPDVLSRFRGNISSKRLEKGEPGSFHIAREILQQVWQIRSPRLTVAQESGVRPQYAHDPIDRGVAMNQHRRRFLVVAGAAVAAATLPFSVLAEEKMKIGIIGSGDVGTRLSRPRGRGLPRRRD
jgi:hypothetical protein